RSIGDTSCSGEGGAARRRSRPGTLPDLRRPSGAAPGDEHGNDVLVHEHVVSAHGLARESCALSPDLRRLESLAEFARKPSEKTRDRVSGTQDHGLLAVGRAARGLYVDPNEFQARSDPFYEIVETGPRPGRDEDRIVGQERGG